MRQPAAHHDIAARRQHRGDAFGLHVGAIGNADFARLDRDPVEPLAASLLSHFKESEALGGQIKGTVDAPYPVAPPGGGPGLRHGGRIDQANQAAAAGRRRRGGKQAADQRGQPIAAPAQPVEQGDIGNIGQPHSAGPGRGRSQAALPQAISQHQPQQHHRTGDPAGALEGLGGAGTGLNRRRSAKAIDNMAPILVQQRCMLHPIVESHTIPTRKPYISAYGRAPGTRFWVGRACGDAAPGCDAVRPVS